MAKINSISYFKYSFLFLYIIGLTFLFRIIETWGILSYFAVDSYAKVFLQEVFGGAGDIGIIVLCFSFIYLFEHIFRLRHKNLELIYLVVFLLFFVVHAILLRYFIAESTPLGEMLFKHSWDEVMYTVQSAGYKMSYVVPLLFGAVAFFFGCFLLFRKSWKWQFKITSLFRGGGFLFILMFMVSLFYISKDNFFTNKSVYFFFNSIKSIVLTKNDSLVNLHYSEKKILQFQEAFPKDYVDSKYPLLHKPDTVNYLRDYFNKFDAPPNIVLLIIEGLNDDFIHKRDGVVLMPFLNQLKKKSLYWKHCFTLGERSFAVIPSTLGGLPYGKVGFAALKNYPTFFSLVSVLKKNNYQVSYNEGQGAWFLSKGKFFQQQEADYVFDMNLYSKESKKIMVNDYFWGYDDKTLFNEALKYKSKHPKTPYLDVYFSGTMHSPFVVQDKSVYHHRYTNLLKKVTDKKRRSVLKINEQYYLTTLFTDDALKEFFAAYTTRPEYNNTVFLITGDHPMTEVPRENSLKRYHVPLIMYSPKLKTSAVSKNVVSHLDIYQTLLNLTRASGVKSPKLSASLGDVLKVEGNYKDRTIVFMEGDRTIEDIYDNGYYLAGKTIYKVHDDWTISEIQEEAIKEKLHKKLDLFKYTNLLSTYHNSLYKMDEYLKFLEKKMIEHETQNTPYKSKELYVSLVSTKLNKTDDLDIKTTVDYIHFSEDVTIVVQLVSQDGKTLFWKNYLIPPGSDKVTFRTKIPASETVIGAKLSVFIWNKKEEEITVRYSDVLVTGDE